MRSCSHTIHMLAATPKAVLHFCSSRYPLAWTGNKIDLGRAASEDELRVELGLHHQTTGKGKQQLNGIRPMELFMCSVVKRAGYGEGFKWLSNYIK